MSVTTLTGTALVAVGPLKYCSALELIPGNNNGLLVTLGIVGMIEDVAQTT